MLRETRQGGREANSEVLDAVGQTSSGLVVQRHEDAAGRREQGFPLDTCLKLELDPKALKPEP